MYAKRIAECAVEAKDMPLQTVLECLNIREGRAGIDNVRDDVESELYKVNKFCINNPVTTSGGSKGGPGRAWAHPINEGPDFFPFSLNEYKKINALSNLH